MSDAAQGSALASIHYRHEFNENTTVMNLTRLVVLGLLAEQGERHGHQLDEALLDTLVRHE